jgi:hypothetical protein
LGYVRLRGQCQFNLCYQEDQPIAGKGRPLWAMYRTIRKMPDGSKIPDTLLTVSQSEAQPLCNKNGWIYDLSLDASSWTCLSGYVAY